MTATLTEDQRDALQELCNVAMGQAGDSLARLLNHFVELSIPTIKLHDVQSLPVGISPLFIDPPVIAGAQVFRIAAHDADQVEGLAIVTVPTPALHALQNLMAVNDQRALLLKLTSVIAGDFLWGLGQQLDLSIAPDSPTWHGVIADTDSMLATLPRIYHSTLCVDLNYRLEQHNFQCGLILLLPDQAFVYLQNRLQELLG
jgi:chemotaxis protein CheY-P-specific phosphatase CheC